jgi:hypothetical protein
MEQIPNTNDIDRQILNQFYIHAQKTEINKRCIERINSESIDAKYKNKLFEECVSSRINILNSLNKEKN